jgi:hypothetical protein
MPLNVHRFRRRVERQLRTASWPSGIGLGHWVSLTSRRRIKRENRGSEGRENPGREVAGEVPGNRHAMKWLGVHMID